jgi:hypothetical protein
MDEKFLRFYFYFLGFYGGGCLRAQDALLKDSDGISFQFTGIIQYNLR